MGLLTDYVTEAYMKDKKTKQEMLQEKIKKAEAERKESKVKEYEKNIQSIAEMKESDWVQELIENTKNIKLATHVGKFAYPKSKVFIYDENVRTTDGFVTTDNSKVMDDIRCKTSAYMKSAKIMKLRLEDGENVYTHIKNKDKEILEQFKRWGIAEDKLINAVKKMTENENKETDPEIAQVYFPIGNDEYHLLSIVPSSSLMETLSQKIRSMDYDKIKARNPKNEDYGKSGAFIGKRIKICFGGSQPQNISSLNNQYKGEAFMLPSLPPEIMESVDPLPYKDVFNDSVPFKGYIGALDRLHKLFIKKQNNAIIRARIKTNINYIVDVIIETVYRLRQNKPGWTDKDMFTGLPYIQKILIDNQYEDKRKENEWIELISKNFARWFFMKYKQVKKKDAIMYGPEEFDFIKKKFEDVMREEADSI